MTETGGRIIKGVGGLYTVVMESGIKICKPRGIFRKTDHSPLIGDLCAISAAENDKNKFSVIESISERKNELARPKVSNIDAAAVVCAADNINFFTLDKYLIILEEQAAENKFEIVVVINKIDLIDEKKIEKIKNIYGSAGYPVFFLSAATGAGTDAFFISLRGKTTALAGQSGAGKSSIVNLICGKEVMEVGELSKKISRGKHTTRHAELFRTGADGETFIIDTPGFASLKFANVTKANLKNYFKEFAKFSDICRFADCAHINEPGCEVREQAGNKLAASRYENYIKFYEETDER